MKTGSAIALGLVAAAAVGFGVYMVDIDQTEEAALPNVDVTVEGGNLPEFDAEVGSVALTEEEATIEVPNVEVTMEEEQVTVPGIQITPPEEIGEEEDIASN